MESGGEEKQKSGTISLILFLGIGFMFLAGLFVIGALTYEEIKIDAQFLLITGVLMLLGVAFVGRGIQQLRVLKNEENL